MEGVVYGLIVISVLASSHFKVLAWIYFQVVPYNLDVTIIEFNNKIPLSKKLRSTRDIKKKTI